jgi:putative nucleotidyltransferase-like protein
MWTKHEPTHARSAAQRYLRLCGRVFLATASSTELVEAAQALSPDEWRQLIVEATTHGMAPIVYYFSATSGALTLAPQEVAAALAGRYTRTLVSVRRLELRLSEITHAFSTHAQDIFILKGPLLTRRLYPDPALRPIGDIDLLARPGALGDAIDALTALGYQAVPGYENPQEFHALRGWTLIYQRSDAPFVELHWRPVSLASYQRAFSPNDLWRRSIHAEIGGENAHLLDPEDELRYLCVHYAAEHRGKRLIWLIDIARLLQSLPENWEWERFAATTIALGVATPLLSALDDCQRILGLDVSDAPVTTLRAAAASPAEKRDWALAQMTFYQPRRLLAHARTLETPQERLILARGALGWYLAEGRDWTQRRLRLARNRLVAPWR